MIPEPVWNCHSFLPVSASKAMNSPVAAPVNTSPPPVDSVPAMLGTPGQAYCHFALPVIGSSADRKPVGWSFGMVTPRKSMPRYHSPCLYSGLASLYGQLMLNVLP